MEITDKLYIIKVKRMEWYWTGRNLSKNIQNAKIYNSINNANKGISAAKKFSQRQYCIKEVEVY